MPLFIFLFLASRLTNLLALPIFNDEAIYLWMGRQPNPFISFIEGKEPAFFWLLHLFLKIIPWEPLLAGRLLSAAAGLLGLIVFRKLASKLLDKKAATVAAIAYLVSPFLLFYQRLGILDSLQTTILLVALYRLLIFRKKPTVLNSLWLGASVGLALLTKTNSFLFLLTFLPLVPSKKNLGLVGAVAFLLYAVILFQPGYGMIAAKNTNTFVNFPGLPLPIFWANLKLAFRWLVSYQGWPMVLLGLVAPLLVVKKRRLAVIFWLMFLAPIILESLIAKQFFPRYFLFAVIPLAILIGLVFERLPVILAVLVFIPNIIFGLQIIKDVKTAPLQATEEWQYVSGWPAGYGVKETADFLNRQKAKVVVTEDLMIMTYGLPYYYNGRVTTQPTPGAYYVFTQRQTVTSDLLLKFVWEYWRPEHKEKISVYYRGG